MGMSKKRTCGYGTKVGVTYGSLDQSRTPSSSDEEPRSSSSRFVDCNAAVGCSKESSITDHAE